MGTLEYLWEITCVEQVPKHFISVLIIFVSQIKQRYQILSYQVFKLYLDFLKIKYKLYLFINKLLIVHAMVQVIQVYMECLKLIENLFFNICLFKVQKIVEIRVVVLQKQIHFQNALSQMSVLQTGFVIVSFCQNLQYF